MTAVLRRVLQRVGGERRGRPRCDVIVSTGSRSTGRRRYGGDVADAAGVEGDPEPRRRRRSDDGDDDVASGRARRPAAVNRLQDTVAAAR